MARTKHIPRRTCVGCGETQGKRELYRVVRTPAGEVLFDPTGKKNGRGAYVHGGHCLAKALKGERLARALRCDLAPDQVLALQEALADHERKLAQVRPPRVHRAPITLAEWRRMSQPQAGENPSAHPR